MFAHRPRHRGLGTKCAYPEAVGIREPHGPLPVREDPVRFGFDFHKDWCYEPNDHPAGTIG